MLMERSREARRSNMAAANGLSRRRRRSTSLRESHVVDEDVQIELQDTVRLQNRASKRERERQRDRYRDREFSNYHKIQNKRMRGGEESVADEEEFEIEERRAAHTISSSVLNQSSKKSLPPTKFVKQAPALEAADEFNGALVPRKARSVSVKRSHESWFSGNGGFREDQKASSSTSPASRSTEANNSPSSLNVSVRKKMKPNGPKTRLPKVVKSSSVQQEDIEIEIAEVLFGLTKHSHNSKKADGDDNIQKLESKDAKAISEDTKSSVSVMPQSTNPASDLLPDALKKKQVEVDNSSSPVANGSVSLSIKIDSKMETSASHEVDAPKVASMIVEPQQEVTEQGDSELSNEEGSGTADGPVTERKTISAKEESSTCLKMDIDFQDSTVTKANSIALENESGKEEKFKIDLMAPPSMVSSHERDGFNGIASDPSIEPNNVKMKSLIKDEEKMKIFLKKEQEVEEVEEKKIEVIGEKFQLKIVLEKPNQDNGKDNSVKLQQQSQKQQQPQTKPTIDKVEKTESSSVPLKISVAGWPNAVQPLGYMPPFQTMIPMDSSTRSSAVQQTPLFMLSQPRPKRCTTHCYIARNIHLNQQLAKMNLFWPAGAGSVSLHGAKPNNPKAIPSTENIIHEKLPAQEDKNSEGLNFTDSAQKKQLVLQQAPQPAPQPAPAGNLLHAPAFIFPVSKQQAVVTTGANQPGPSTSAATSTKRASVSGSAALPASSAALPAAAAAVSYNFPNLAGNETPYFTILQNNGYQFPVPTPTGTAPAIKGGTHAQALPLFNGSFYSSQIFHPSQLQHQQQPHSQPLMQAAHQNAKVSSASSSSHKQLHSQQSKGVPVGGNNFVSSIGMQSQQTQKQRVSSSNQNRKLESEMSGEKIPSVADSRLSHNQTSVYGQNFSVPLQPLNFALMPSPAVGSGSTGGTHNEKQQQSQQKGGVEFVPQASAMPFASFSGSNSPSNLIFSSLQHNPAILQSLPDVARRGYQVVPASQAAPQKTHQIPDVMTGGGSSNHDEGKKQGLGKSFAANAQMLYFDDSARTLNFVSSPITGNWPSRSITSTAITTNVPVAANSQNFQQQHLLQLQKQQMLQQQHQAAAARSKAQTTNCSPSSSIAAKLSAQSNNSSQSQWKNSARNPTNQVPLPPLSSSSTSNIKNISQQEVRSPKGHTHISFERHSKSSSAPQGQQTPTSNQSALGGGNLRTSSPSSKCGSSFPALQSQQTQNSSASTGQKSSPVCGRNVPAILSTCPSHLSELEY